MANITIDPTQVRPLSGAIVRQFEAGEATYLGRLVRIPADGDPVQADATTEAGITGQIGMIVSGSRAAADGAVIEGEAIGVALAGPIYVGASAGMDETALHYISEDAGRLADSQPSTYLRPVGYPLSQTVFNLAPAAETPTAYGS